MGKTGSKYISYLRVSTDRQGRSGLGIDAQRETVTRTIGRTADKEFVETESGRNNERPALREALAACRVHRAVLVIAKLDRLSRNQRFLMELIDNKDVEVIFCDLPQIPKGPAGRFMLQQMAAVAELEAGLISERTKAALAAKVARDGQWDRNAKHHLVAGAGQKAATAAVKAKATQIASDLSPVIADIQAAGHATLRAIAAELNSRGIPTARGGEWSAVQVQRVMQRAVA
ncbi:recombinase family protein [Azospirillum canadense]|uniref:recombinase family protein n=1 Tax=Azospirillum canadense TaxID=403962 RepID=UPI00222706BE|nr:recombinase family protein [Azospirillum canadense]MCW2237468.1 DNA invertase Pin-like site-specific DNA recombinase [Azospirillum canadense]